MNARAAVYQREAALWLDLAIRCILDGEIADADIAAKNAAGALADALLARDHSEVADVGEKGAGGAPTRVLTPPKHPLAVL